jgi:hypothetical protein
MIEIASLGLIGSIGRNLTVTVLTGLRLQCRSMLVD